MFEFISAAMAKAGYLGLAFLMVGENVFPPIPSEIVVPLGGFLAAQGVFWLPLVILVATSASVLGASFWYWVGVRLGEARLRRLVERHGRWLTLTPEDVDRSADWFRRKGGWAILVGRMLPGSRTLISVPAGIARMPMLPFLAFSFAGSLVWIGGLAVLGYVLESQYQRIGPWLDPLTWVVILAALGIYVWRLIRYEAR